MKIERPRFAHHRQLQLADERLLAWRPIDNQEPTCLLAEIAIRNQVKRAVRRKALNMRVEVTAGFDLSFADDVATLLRQRGKRLRDVIELDVGVVHGAPLNRCDPMLAYRP